MFPSPRAIEISSTIAVHSGALVEEISSIQHHAHRTSYGEVEYFRKFFTQLEILLNTFRIKGVNFQCRTAEIHQKPIVKYGRNSKCELGDYFVNIKYFDQGKLLGRKLVIYQFKMDQNAKKIKIGRPRKLKWKIDKKQLYLLCNWPTFKFGNKPKGYNTFTLTPKTPDLGSFWLASRQPLLSAYRGLYSPYNLYDIVKPSISVKMEMQRNFYQLEEKKPFPCYNLAGSLGLVLQMMWRYGEFVETGTPIDDLLDTLYRFVEWAPDPEGEFDGFKSKNENEGGFWGIEIKVLREG